MPSWVIVFKDMGGMPGLLGPYTRFRADRLADKLEERHEVVDTVSQNSVRAKREIKEKLVNEYGYSRGSKRIHKPTKVAEYE